MVSSLSSSVTLGFYYCGLWFVIFDSRWARLNPQRAAYIHQKWAYEVGGALVVGVPDYSIVTNILRRRKATCNEINLPRPGRPLPGLGRKSCGMDSPLAGGRIARKLHMDGLLTLARLAFSCVVRSRCYRCPMLPFVVQED